MVDSYKERVIKEVSQSHNEAHVNVLFLAAWGHFCKFACILLFACLAPCPGASRSCTSSRNTPAYNCMAALLQQENGCRDWRMFTRRAASCKFHGYGMILTTVFYCESQLFFQEAATTLETWKKKSIDTKVAKLKVAGDCPDNSVEFYCYCSDLKTELLSFSRRMWC